MSKLDEWGGLDGLKADIANRVKYEVHTVPRLYAEALIEHIEELNAERQSYRELAQAVSRFVANAEEKARELLHLD